MTTKLTLMEFFELVVKAAHSAGAVVAARAALAATSLAEAASVLTDPNALAAIYVAAKLAVHLIGEPMAAYLEARYGSQLPAWTVTAGKLVRRLLPKAQIRWATWQGLLDALANGIMLAPLATWLWHAPHLGMDSIATLGMHEYLGFILLYEVYESLLHHGHRPTKGS